MLGIRGIRPGRVIQVRLAPHPVDEHFAVGVEIGRPGDMGAIVIHRDHCAEQVVRIRGDSPPVRSNVTNVEVLPLPNPISN